MAVRSKRFKSLAFTGALLLVALGVFLCERLVFPRIGYSLICSEAPRPADLILVLGGDFWGPRVLKGAELGKLGYAPLVMISGPPYKGRPEGEWAIDFLERLGYPRSLFCAFGHTATSTVDEALAIARELHRRKVKRVLVVTSAYHSRRADLVLRLFSDSIQFTSVPAPDPVYTPGRWWDDPDSRRVFFSEWRKILGSVLVAYPAYEIKQLLPEAREEP
ncbi:MAG: YdcF family protein [Acidobacteriia bacterium]|nr:YdcF family protein [Terriglobia bacterium]